MSCEETQGPESLNCDYSLCPLSSGHFGVSNNDGQRLVRTCDQMTIMPKNRASEVKVAAS
jgi:hypothetical protein